MTLEPTGIESVLIPKPPTHWSQAILGMAVPALPHDVPRETPEDHGMTILPNMNKRVDFALVMCYI